MSGQSRQLAAIMFTDIVGYTALMGKDEQKAFDFLSKNRLIQKLIIEQYNGRWIKELGDGVMASFNTVSDAVNAAIKIQKKCNTDKDFQLRIGIHLGEVVFENDDVFGDGVNIASRIQALAPPGGIWISESVHNNVSNKIDIATEFVKTEHLKNVKDPVRIYQVKVEGVEAPEPVISAPEKLEATESKTQKYRKPVLFFIGAVLILASGYFIYNSFQKTAKENTPSKVEEVIDRSIAVLPFQNLGGGQDMDFLQLALADEIATMLSYTPNLIIRPSASTRKYSGLDVDARIAGSELGVATIITGHFAREADRLRVTLQAIEVKSNRVMWGETVRTMAQDWIGMEEQIQSRIRQRLFPMLGLITTPTDIRTRPSNADAYELFLRSVMFPNTENKQAIVMLEQAILLDAHYATAWATLAQRYYWHASYEEGGEVFYRHADRAFRQALSLDPNLVAAATGLIFLTTESGQLTTAHNMAQDLVHRRPDNALAHLSLSYVLRFAGLVAEATSECETARALDPQEVRMRSCGFAFMMAGDYEKALGYWKMGPETEWSNNAISFILLRQGKHEEVLQLTARLVQNPTWPARFVDAYLRKRPAPEVKRLADEYVSTTLRVRRDPDSAYLDGSLLAFCEQKEAALKLLRIAVAGNFCMGEVLDNDPLLDKVRSTPEFVAIRAEGYECQKKFLAHRGR